MRRPTWVVALTLSLVAGCGPTGTSPTTDDQQGVVVTSTTTTPPPSTSTTLATTSSSTTTTLVTTTSGVDTVVEGQSATEEHFGARRVLADYSVAWIDGTAEPQFVAEPGSLGVLSQSGAGPGCWSIGGTTLLIADQLQNRIVIRDLTTGGETTHELPPRSSPVACLVAGDSGQVLFDRLESGAQHTDIVSFDLTTGDQTAADTIPDSVAGKLFLSFTGEVWVSYTPLLDVVPAEDFAFLPFADLEAEPQATWEISAGEAIYTRSTPASITLAGANGQRVWRIDAAADEDRASLLDERAWQDGIVVLAVEVGLIHVWNLSTGVTDAITVDMDDLSPFESIPAALWMHAADPPSLVVLEGTTDRFRFVEYTAD